MPIRIVALPRDGDEQAAPSCNTFLRGQRVLSA